MTPRDPLTVWCLYCIAPPGTPCRKRGLDHYHRARLRGALGMRGYRASDYGLPTKKYRFVKNRTLPARLRRELTALFAGTRSAGR